MVAQCCSHLFFHDFSFSFLLIVTPCSMQVSCSSLTMLAWALCWFGSFFRPRYHSILFLEISLMLCRNAGMAPPWQQECSKGELPPEALAVHDNHLHLPPSRSTVDAHRYEARRGLRAELLRSTSRTGLRARATHRSHVWALERRSTTE